MVADESPNSWPVISSRELLSNWLITVRTDRVRLPDAGEADRTVITHVGAVAILALDEQGRVLMIRQYRHPVARELWEIPAGLRDADGEALVDTARRELLEETGYEAREWWSLVDSYASPGITNEKIRIFLARDLVTADSDYKREAEEKFLRTDWVPLADAAAQALAGKIHNGATIQGILAAYIASGNGFTALRPADAPEG
jgi:ADP-ribose pyrophosphatase